MSATIIRGDARALPLADNSVDLIVTSPPYFALRSYQDGGEHYAGQIGAEPTPADYIAALVECTREWMRILKPSGSIWVNLGDKHAGAPSGPQGATAITDAKHNSARTANARRKVRSPIRNKSLMLLPERYRIACVDELGLIARAVVVWSKPNGLPESVTDRVRRSHEDWVHLVKQPRYYSAVDAIRQEHAGGWGGRGDYNAKTKATPGQSPHSSLDRTMGHPLGKLPGSVWEIPTEPLKVPEHLGVDHFAAFPTEWPRRIILGWSPSGICTACGEGRRPVVDRKSAVPHVAQANARATEAPRGLGATSALMLSGGPRQRWRAQNPDELIGEMCACTPYTDHPGTGEPSGPHGRHANAGAAGTYENVGADWGGKGGLGDRPRVGPWREYHLNRWTPAPTRPAVVLDPFGGTGTVALVADVLGRRGVSVDRSADYCRLAAWRTTDPGERAKAMRVEKPAKELDGQDALFEVGA